MANAQHDVDDDNRHHQNHAQAFNRILEGLRRALKCRGDGGRIGRSSGSRFGGAARTARRPCAASRRTPIVSVRHRTGRRATYSMPFDRYQERQDGPDIIDDDRSSPVGAPRTPAPKSRHSAVALPEPDDDGENGARS
jgi:hypothetical protein